MNVSQIDLISGIIKLLDRQGVKVMNARQTNAVIAAANTVVNALAIEHRPATPGMGLTAWLESDDTGMSSRYMACALATLTGLQQAVYVSNDGTIPSPRDPDDFGRCVRLLDAVPELREHIPALKDGHGPAWAGLVAAWDELEALYREELPSGKAPRLYERMRGIEEGAR